MEADIKGQKHGAAVRRAASLAADLAIAFGKDLALNVRRGGGYAKGFLDGLRRPQDPLPNA